METIQIVLDEKLLQAADRAARKSKQNRSALLREALRRHLNTLDLHAKETQDREGYAKMPQNTAHRWEGEAAWPAE
jgi:metal-responsive CopG/Arc/MetJ family transcriptional regulator